MANTKITSRVLANDAVLTANIADDAVTSAKLDTNITVAGTLTSTGALTANAGVVVDNTTIDGNSWITTGGGMTIDVVSDITLDADGGNIYFKHAGTTIGALTDSSSDFVIASHVDDKDILFRSDDGAGGITTYFYLDGSEAAHDGSSTTATYTRFPDLAYLSFGDSKDYNIRHHSNGVTYLSGTTVEHSSNTWRVKNLAGSETLINALADGAVTLYHDNTERLATSSDGIDVTGHIDSTTLTTTGNVTVGGDLTVSGSTTTLNTATLDVEDKNITLNKGSGDTSGSANGAGITIQDAVDASNDATLLWDASNDEFDFSHKVTAPALTVDDITIDGSTISDSGDITIDSGANITLDADGGAIGLNDGGTHYASFENSSNSLYIETKISDKDIILRGNDGGSTITALTLDMSEAGAATFNSSVNATNYLVGGAQGSDGQVLTSTGSGVAWETPSAFNADAAQTFNDSGAAVDFRIEGDTEQNLFFVDGSADKIGIGTASPAKPLHISSADNQPLRVESTDAYSGIEIKDNGSSTLPPLISALSDDLLIYTGHGSSRVNVAKFDNDGKTYIKEIAALDASLEIGNGDEKQIFDGSAETIDFQVSDTERLSITANGITFNGDTAAANALDDYEEGTWTPVFGQSGGGDGGTTYTYQYGQYTKIGNIVHCWVDVQHSQMWSWQGSYMFLTLPFTASDDNWYAGVTPWDVSTAFTDTDRNFNGYVGTSTNQLRLYKTGTGNNGSNAVINWNQVGRISFSVTYNTDT